MNKIDPKHLAGYEDDFALWSAEQAALLRAGRYDRLDVENVAEEIESLGRSNRHQIVSRMIVILTHLLKWEFQPARRTNSWLASLVENRDAIAVLINDSPSLRPYPATVIDRAYRPARLAASGETGIALAKFPRRCPYAADQILDIDFLPGPVAD